MPINKDISPETGRRAIHFECMEDHDEWFKDSENLCSGRTASELRRVYPSVFNLSTKMTGTCALRVDDVFAIDIWTITARSRTSIALTVMDLYSRFPPAFRLTDAA
eukprot:Blabericola_migrator_1__5790@NODE_2933_length_2193_cov_4_080433_g1839_i0_p1_GENE_NODE_2933_length_2193_cov_4_080433_g1839_i0NODE_2933_length_2193_cov_4_080433_g1839_i0_p1_ORF_typecomplete_len106_score7_45rve/PF00665_26/0_079_NODE_2933_length_2193_cov_4_080433_g1839_i016101927